MAIRFEYVKRYVYLRVFAPPPPIIESEKTISNRSLLPSTLAVRRPFGICLQCEALRLRRERGKNAYVFNALRGPNRSFHNTCRNTTRSRGEPAGPPTIRVCARFWPTFTSFVLQMCLAGRLPCDIHSLKPNARSEQNPRSTNVYWPPFGRSAPVILRRQHVITFSI